jgi:hypothetical protein
LFWFGYEACLHGISRYVVADFLGFAAVATPVVVGFLLPEWLFDTLEDLIGATGSNAF